MEEKRKAMIFAVLTMMVVAISGIGFYYWYNSTYYVTTEDARVTGDLVKVSPQVSGKLLVFNVEEGDTVFEDQILGRQEMGSLSDSNIEQTLIRAPITGLVIKKQANIREMVSSGQALAMLIDPEKLYISANIEETKLNRVKPGHIVDITVDQFAGIKFTGKVTSVGLASNSTFSLLPTSTSGTFTKVVQRIPVKIELDRYDTLLLPGTNAVVKIHVK
ncbi:MAG: HlyD family efflux transporter periplasmic adaptor subunit [Dehalobacterium sp.]